MDRYSGIIDYKYDSCNVLYMWRICPIPMLYYRVYQLYDNNIISYIANGTTILQMSTYIVDSIHCITSINFL